MHEYLKLYGEFSKANSMNCLLKHTESLDMPIENIELVKKRYGRSR